MKKCTKNCFYQVDGECFAFKETEKIEIRGEKKKEEIHHASHYQLEGLGIEVMDVIKSVLTPEEYRGFLKGNVLKYSLRAGKKTDDEMKDLKKCTEYINYLSKVSEVL